MYCESTRKPFVIGACSSRRSWHARRGGNISRAYVETAILVRSFTHLRPAPASNALLKCLRWAGDCVAHWAKRSPMAVGLV